MSAACYHCAVTYREPDQESLAELEQERRAREQARERSRAADAAAIRAMKSPFHGLGRHVPRGITRVAVYASLTGVVFPLVVATLAVLVRPPDEVSPAAVWAVLLVGCGAGLVGVACGVAALLSPSSARLAGVAAVLTGLFALPCSLGCAVLVALTTSGMR